MAQQDGAGGDPPAALPPLSEMPAGGFALQRIVGVALARLGTVLVGGEDGALTGRELLLRAAGTCAAVRSANPSGRPVAVLRPHGSGAVAAALGVMAAGAPLVVLDPTTSAERLQHELAVAGSRTCVSGREHACITAQLPVRVLDAEEAAGAAADVDAAVRELTAVRRELDDPALVVFTAGSTGEPRAVSWTHRAVLARARAGAAGRACPGPGDAVAHLLSMASVAGLETTLGCLLVGARQELFDPRTRPVADLPAWLAAVGADALVVRPGALRAAVAALPTGARLGELSTLTVVGEALHGAELAALRRAVGPRCRVRHRYGSTETGLISEFVLEPGDPAPQGPLPAGWALPGARLGVEAPDGSVRPVGTGRVVLTADWLGTSYWGDQHLAAERYLDHPDGSRSHRTGDLGSLGADGCLRLLGRDERTVLVRGARVAPAEVEAVLFAHPGVRDAVVVGRPAPSTGRVRLVAHVVPTGDGVPESELRDAVRAALPAQAVPERIVLLPVLPRTARGQVDVDALAEPPDVAVGADEPRADLERVVADLVARVLELPRVGVHDDFAALGGDAPAAEALLAALATEVGVDDAVLEPSLLAAAPTPAALAAVLRRHRRVVHPTATALRASGSRPPLFCVAGAGGLAIGLRPLADRLDPDQPVHALQAPGLEGRALPDWSVQRAASRHLHSIRGVRPHGPYRLAGHGIGALIALEIADRLRRAGEEVELLAVLDALPPGPGRLPQDLRPSLPQRAVGLAAVVGAGVLPRRSPGRYVHFERYALALQRSYHPPLHTGRTLVVVAADGPFAPARARWQPHLGGDWQLRRIPGDHLSILRPPHVDALAEAVQAALDALPPRPRLPQQRAGAAPQPEPAARAELGTPPRPSGA